jgi:hypothetical protein
VRLVCASVRHYRTLTMQLLLIRVLPINASMRQKNLAAYRNRILPAAEWKSGANLSQATTASDTDPCLLPVSRPAGRCWHATELSHHPESDNSEMMIKRVGEPYSCTPHDDDASCVDSRQFVEVGAAEIFPRPPQIA